MGIIEMMGEGYIWTDATVLTADLEVDEEAARAMMPPGLELSSPPTATVFVADYPQTAFGSVYREAAVLLVGHDDDGALRHCPWMVVDDDTALIIGREALGFPKKMADIDLTVSGDRVLGTVERRGAEVLRIECQLDPGPAEAGTVFAHRFVNACGTMVHGLDLLDVPPTTEEIHECRSGPAKVTLSTSERDVLGALAPPTEVEARLVHLDFGGGASESRVLGPADPDWVAARALARTL